MPKFTNNDEMLTHKLSNFQYSSVKFDKLVENDYTLVGIAVDTTCSVSPFADDLLDALKTAIESCQKAPRSENLLMRITEFNTGVGIKEIHGFKLLSDIDIDVDYEPFRPNNMTNLFDATADMVETLSDYGAQLTAKKYLANGVIFIITDGWDNASMKATPDSIKRMIESTRVEEKLESIQTVLIGVNVDQTESELQTFKSDALLDQFINIKDASKGSLAKLAAFVSRSVSSTSQALGTGQSVQLTF